jgi:hypothetical protein
MFDPASGDAGVATGAFYQVDHHSPSHEKYSFLYRFARTATGNSGFLLETLGEVQDHFLMLLKNKDVFIKLPGILF